ncbi:hypothetical protein FB446DRAFT_742969 [Lentinula raphanica]|nr:hypothetical protein FB446DRAFT_742969 [Lentinula raphanica]
MISYILNLLAPFGSQFHSARSTVGQIPPSLGDRHSDRLMRYSKICVSIVAILVSFGSAVTEYMQEQLLSFVLAMIAIVLLAMNQVLDLMTDLGKAPLLPTVDPRRSLSDPGRTYASGEEREANRSGGEGSRNGGDSSNNRREENNSGVEGISSGVDNSSSGGDDRRLRTVTPAPSTSSNSENRSVTVPRPQNAPTSQPPDRPSAAVSGTIVRHPSWSQNAQRSLTPVAASTSSIPENRLAIVPDRRQTSTSRWPDRPSTGVDRRHSARDASWSQRAQTADLPWLGKDISSRVGLRQRTKNLSPESYAYTVEETGQESDRGGRRRTGSKRS